MILQVASRVLYMRGTAPDHVVYLLNIAPSWEPLSNDRSAVICSSFSGGPWRSVQSCVKESVFSRARNTAVAAGRGQEQVTLAEYYRKHLRVCWLEITTK